MLIFLLWSNWSFVFAQCPLYGKVKEPKKLDDKSKEETTEDNNNTQQEKQNDLMQDGLVFKQCVRDKLVDRRAHNQVNLCAMINAYINLIGHTVHHFIISDTYF